ARKTRLCWSIASTRVVLPWSTWAMIATFRSFMSSTGAHFEPALKGSSLPRGAAQKAAVVLLGVDPGEATRIARYVHDPVPVVAEDASRAALRGGRAQGRPGASREAAGVAAPSLVRGDRDGGAGGEGAHHAVDRLRRHQGMIHQVQEHRLGALRLGRAEPSPDGAEHAVAIALVHHRPHAGGKRAFRRHP